MLARFLVPYALGCLLGLASLPAAAANPSFDCENARTSVEKLVCADEELAALDLEVAKAYARALSKAPAQHVGELKAEQSSWRRQLLRCENADDERSCTLGSYQARLKQL